MNLLYVAMTRTQQALIVSGSQGGRESRSASWYERIAAAVGQHETPAPLGLSLSTMLKTGLSKPILGQPDSSVHPSTGSGRTGNVSGHLPPIIPAGQRAARNTVQQQRGIRLHALLQHLTEGVADKAGLQQRLAIPPEEFEPLWQQARQLLASPQLARFFDAGQYRAACNEMPYVNARGELKRIDRLVEFDDEVWVLDYKLGTGEDAARYRAQMQEYRSAMQAVHAGRTVRGALLFADGTLREME